MARLTEGSVPTHLGEVARVDLLERVRQRLWREIDPSYEGAYRDCCGTIDRVVAKMKAEGVAGASVPEPIQDIRRVDAAIHAILGERATAFVDATGSLERAEALRTCAERLFVDGKHAGSSGDAEVVRAALHELSRTGRLAAAANEA